MLLLRASRGSRLGLTRGRGRDRAGRRRAERGSVVGFGFEQLGEGAEGAAGAVVEAHADPRVAGDGVEPDDLAFEEERVPEVGGFDGEGDGGAVGDGFEHFHAGAAEAEVDEAGGALPGAVPAADDGGEADGAACKSTEVVQAGPAHRRGILPRLFWGGGGVKSSGHAAGEVLGPRRSLGFGGRVRYDCLPDLGRVTAAGWRKTLAYGFRRS